SRPLDAQRLTHGLELGLGEDLDVAGSSQPLGAQLHLGYRLLTGHEQRGARLTDRAQGHQEQRRLSDARLTSEQHERRGHETASEHAVELRDTGRDPRRLLDLDLHEAERNACGRSSTARPGGDYLLDERAEGRAAGTFAEPASGAVAALRAAELDGRGLRLSHDATLSVAADATVTAFPQLRAENGSGPADWGRYRAFEGVFGRPPPHRGPPELC